MLLLLSLGCVVDEVVVEGIDEFGPVASATWARVPTGDGSPEPDVLILSTVDDHCEKLRDYLVAQEALTVAQEMASAEGYCAAVAEPTRAWAEASRALYPQGARSMTFRLAPEPGGDVPYVGTFTSGEDTSGLTAWVIYAEEDAFGPYLTDWDEAGAGPTCGTTVGGDGWADLLWMNLEGTLEVTSVTADTRVVGAFEGGGGDAALNETPFTVSASFAATFCDAGD